MLLVTICLQTDTTRATCWHWSTFDRHYPKKQAGIATWIEEEGKTTETWSHGVCNEDCDDRAQAVVLALVSARNGSSTSESAVKRSLLLYQLTCFGLFQRPFLSLAATPFANVSSCSWTGSSEQRETQPLLHWWSQSCKFASISEWNIWTSTALLWHTVSC